MKSLILFLKTVRWQDVLDIFINSYILFRVYVLFHQTNAFRVLVGIAILWISQKIAMGLGLVITSWVLQAVIALAAIIVIVVFRNELRSALQIQNLRSFIWGTPRRSQQETPIQTIVEAITQMGRKRIGSIIVFPGKEDISELIHGGIPWNGKISQEMITSIFWPNNPVHDGAIIIDGDRVKEVSVLLPLSQRSDLPTFYGTRHRAAIGLSERSDALVIVVSEERGRVSVASRGLIKAVYDHEELYKLIAGHLQPFSSVKKDKPIWKKIPFKTIGAATASIIIITSAWFAFTRSRDLVMSVDAPIEFLNRPADLELLDVNPTKVTLYLSGSSALIRSIKPHQIEVKVSLRHEVAGKNIIPITQDNISLPPGIFVNRIEPHYVEITLDTIITKEVNVQVDWEGHLDDNLLLQEVSLTPVKLQLTGGKSILSKMSTVYTVPVKLDTIKRSGNLSVPVVITPASVKISSNTPDRVVIEYFVKNRKTMELIPP